MKKKSTFGFVFLIFALTTPALLALAGCQASPESSIVSVSSDQGEQNPDLRVVVKNEPSCLDLRDQIKAGEANDSLRAIFISTCLVEVPPPLPLPPRPLPFPALRCEWAATQIDSGRKGLIPGFIKHCAVMCDSLAATDSAAFNARCVLPPRPVPPPHDSVRPPPPPRPDRCLEAQNQLARCLENAQLQALRCEEGAANNALRCGENAANHARQCGDAAARHAEQCARMLTRYNTQCTDSTGAALDKPGCEVLKRDAALCTENANRQADQCAANSARLAQQCTENSQRHEAQCALNSQHQADQCAQVQVRVTAVCSVPGEPVEETPAEE
jgi:hypothetical protein